MSETTKDGAWARYEIERAVQYATDYQYNARWWSEGAGEMYIEPAVEKVAAALDAALARAETAEADAAENRGNYERACQTIAARDAAMLAAASFVGRAIEAHCTGRWWADADMQDELEACGFLSRVVVDVPCGSQACCCERGDDCLKVSALGDQVRRALTLTPEVPRG